MSDIILAIDGYSACGKSSTAREVAKRLAYVYLDTGAMYRAVTLFFLEHHIKPEDSDALAEALKSISLRFAFDREKNENSILLNGENVENRIRLPEVNNMVSQVAAVSAVRRFLVAMQQEMGESKALVADGRDIGTVVFPKAELKIFMTADIDVRARRRKAELERKGIRTSLEDIKKNLLERDRIDTSREDSPLKKAKDAFTLDTTHTSFEQQVQIILDRAEAETAVGSEEV